MSLIYREDAIDALELKSAGKAAIDAIKNLPSVDAVPVVLCKDCKHQEKFFHEDRRRKDGGYYIYGCELSEEYSHVCLDHDFCSWGERREDD